MIKTALAQVCDHEPQRGSIDEKEHEPKNFVGLRGVTLITHVTGSIGDFRIWASAAFESLLFPTTVFSFPCMYETDVCIVDLR